jgi:lipoprotein-releasing system ATP-binding protein
VSEGRDVVVRGRGISRTFLVGETHVEAVRSCDIDIRAGELTAIVGRSGSGKSTLCHILSGIDRPTSGTVELLGRDLSTLNDAAMSDLRARSLGFVLQRDNLVPWLTIEENVAAPLIFAGTDRRTALERARAALADVGLDHRADSWPNLVSGGEAQRAAVVRACINSPAVVFADEPTGALDLGNGERVRRLFGDLVRDQGAAGVLITHDAEVASDADVVLHMADGRIEPAEETVA